MAISGAFANASARRGRILRPSRLSLYMLGQMLGPVAMLAFLMTGVIWLVESLRLLDVVINHGQSAITFTYLASLYLPTLLTIILPVAFFFGSVMALQRLSSDSELVVMAASGFSLRQMAGPVLAVAVITMALTGLCSLYLAPAGQRALHSKEVDINADVGAALLNEGQFNPFGKGLTVFLKRINDDGSFSNILVHDGRDAGRPFTYVADRGQLAQTPAGARLLMFNGTVESGIGRQMSILKFDRYVVNLDQFAAQARDSVRRTSDRFLPELLWPPEKNLSPRIRAAFAAEAHNSLSQPLYCLCFALIALAAVARGRRHRGPVAMRLILASLAAIALRLAGYGVYGAAQGHPALVPLFYTIPLGGALVAILVLAGYSPNAILARHRLARSQA